MEWVEVTARTVEEAKEAALDQLGVDESEAEFEVVEEPKAGLFGRLRSEARVRARIAPTSPRPKQERRDRRRSRRGRPGAGPGDGDGGDGAAAIRPAGPAGPAGAGAGRSAGAQSGGAARASAHGREGDDMAEEPDDDWAGDDGRGSADEVEVAEEFLTGLLDVFGVRYELHRRDLEDDLVEVGVVGDDLGLLIGPRGQSLAAVQELTRTVIQRRSRGRPGRVVVDVAGYRQARRDALARFAREAAEQVVASGVARVLEPMPPPDRKVVHDAVNPIPGVRTTSEGEEPRRRVVIVPDAPAT
jgi:spoIIIJ-associated protein